MKPLSICLKSRSTSHGSWRTSISKYPKLNTSLFPSHLVIPIRDVPNVRLIAVNNVYGLHKPSNHFVRTFMEEATALYVQETVLNLIMKGLINK